MSINEHFEHAQNIALHEIRTLVLICQPCSYVYRVIFVSDIQIFTTMRKGAHSQTVLNIDGKISN